MLLRRTFWSQSNIHGGCIQGSSFSSTEHDNMPNKAHAKHNIHLLMAFEPPSTRNPPEARTEKIFVRCKNNTHTHNAPVITVYRH